MKRTRYTRTDGGEYVSRKVHPLNPKKRVRLVGATRFELEERQEVLRRYQQERRVGIIRSDEELQKKLNPLGRREPAYVRALWDRHVANAAPEHARKLNSVWRRELAPWFDGCVVVDLTAQRMARWDREFAAAGYAPKTAHDAFGHLSAAIRGGIPEFVDELPWKLPNGRMWKPPRKTTPLHERPACGTIAELEALIAAALVVDKVARAANRFADAAHRIAVVALLALRNGEGAGLGWDDLTFEGGRARARIRHQAKDQWRTHYPDWTRPLSPPKGKKELIVALHPTAIAALLAQRELLEQWGWYRPNGPVFPSPLTGDWRPNANCIKPEVFKRFAMLAGLPEWETWVPHSLRHSAATLEEEAGASLKSIQQRTRHGSLRVLEEYIHARTGRALVPSAIPALRVTFDAGEEGEDDK